jgi:uncharacterized membrane protein required for colicin V production
MGVVDEAVQNRVRVGWVPEHLIIPLILIGESLKFLLLTPITRFLGPFYGWQTGLLAVGRLWLWSFFRMAENDRCPSL